MGKIFKAFFSLKTKFRENILAKKICRYWNKLMKRIIFALALAACLFGCTTSDDAQNKQPRKVAVQAYSLNRFTLEETLQKLAPLGLDGIECYPGQFVSKSMPGVKMGPQMTKEQRDYVKNLLKKANLKVVSFGVTGAKNEKEVEALCQFAKDFGFDKILTEAPVAMFPIWEKYGQKYGVTMCLHHHAKDSANQYYDADLVLKYIKDYQYVKANPDVGHLSRSQIQPIENLKKLKGKIGSIHIKDQAEFGNPKNQCVPLGTGQLDDKAILEELDEQGYDGYYVIEYEANWDNNVPDIAKCVQFLRQN